LRGVTYKGYIRVERDLSENAATRESQKLHTAHRGPGDRLAARRFGISRAGCGLSALAFSASGFFVIHMPHHWGYTAGSWMPWAWGLAWSTVGSPTSRLQVRLLLLTLVLVLQLLPGHFQLAFLTQVGILLMLAWFLVDPMSGSIGE